ncbi:flavin-binding monooxygenase [Fonsecaea pedrosoi]|nr:flavin-binding monooxygenase [Fonsecaea pedrosoi]
MEKSEISEHLQGSRGIVDGNLYATMNGVNSLSIEKTNHSISRGHIKVIVVGAGVAGITQAATLLDDKTITTKEMVVFDVLDGFGGVWEKNRYPGCACDVPALMYSSRMMINTEYTHTYATRDQIQTFYERMARHYGVDRCTQFRTFVNSCRWDDQSFVWHVQTENQNSGNLEHWTADVVIHAIGNLDRPKFGGIPGLEDYQGLYWHTSAWNSDVDLTNKRVAVVGCGPSSAQIIPEIVDKVEHLTVYMRTPPMVLPREDFKHSDTFMWCMRHLPLFAITVRFIEIMKGYIFGQLLVTEGSWLNESFTKKGHDFLEQQVKEPELRDILRPDFKFLCKRPLFLNTFYPSLMKSNCTLAKEKIVRYTKTGIISLDRITNEENKRDFDVIIIGTGFNAAQFLEHERVTGRNGIDLQEQWKEYPSSIYGVATSNFPNFFYCNGPNANTFSSNIHDINELASKFISMLVREIFRRNKLGLKFAMMPEPQFEDVYNKEIQWKLRNVVMQNPNCGNSTVKDQNNHNTVLHHRHILVMKWRLRSINWKEWIALQAPPGEKQSPVTKAFLN